MSHAELVALVGRFLNSDPALIALLPLSPLPDPKAGPADEETLRQLVTLAVKRRVIGAQLAADGLAELDTLSQAYLGESDSVSAARLNILIAQALLPTTAQLYHRGGRTTWAWEDYLAHFWVYLNSIAAPEVRASLVRLLLPLFLAPQPYNYRDAETTLLKALQENLRPDEIRLVINQAEALLKGSSPRLKQREHNALTRLTVTLGQHDLPLETLIQRSIEMRQYDAIIARLVAEGQVERLAEAMLKAGRDPINTMLNHVLGRGQGNRLIGEVERGLRLDLWPCLAKASIPGNENLAEAVALAELKRQPDTWNYHYWRSSLETHHLWDRLRPRLEVQLEALERYDALIDLARDDGNIEAALRWVDRLPGRDPLGRAPQLRMQVAHDAAQEHPHEALVLYAEEAEALIAVRNRSRYESAVAILLMMRDIYDRLGQHDSFETYIAALRVEYQRLSALQKLLTSAGL